MWAGVDVDVGVGACRQRGAVRYGHRCRQAWWLGLVSAQ